MIESRPEKIIYIITTSILEAKIVRALKRAEVNGYTVFDVRGDGDSGVQDGHSEGQTNVMFMVVMTQGIYDVLVANLDEISSRGHHVFYFSSDVDVMTKSKFE